MMGNSFSNGRRRVSAAYVYIYCNKVIQHVACQNHTYECQITRMSANISENHIRAFTCRTHTRECQIHTHTCQTYSRVCIKYTLRVKSHCTCRNLTLRVETNLMRVEITLMRVEFTFFV
jgi:hypothetical protein